MLLILVDCTVSVIDTTTNTVVKTIPVGFQPSAIAYDPENNRMYVDLTSKW